jgi:UDP-GlcNAc:undecaprenyl-phosphate/decaprenyl-phosphate GlcNAc-1-phosphate transferase
LADELRLALAFLLALGGTAVAVPPVIRLAQRTRFLDEPAGYKQHERPTPYLGGLAVMAAFLPVTLIFGGGASGRLWPVVLCAALLWAVGTLDDRVGLGPGVRIAVEVVAAGVLWAGGLGWHVFPGEMGDLLLTVFWTVGVVNAFNLMDNLDGAAGTVGMVCAAGAGTVADIESDPVLAALSLALSGACTGFLFFNLGRPARIFLGDGGSMPLGLVIAAAVMAIPTNFDPGGRVLLASIPLVGLLILDTALVIVSRVRRGVNVLSGGRDHVTHRLLRWLPSPATVALVLGLAQAGLCLLTVALLRVGEAAALGAIAACLLLGAAIIAFLDAPRAQLMPQAEGPEPRP